MEKINGQDWLKNNSKKVVVAATLAAIVVMAALSSFVIVHPGMRGVLVQMGAVKDTIFEEGLRFKIPFVQNVISMNVQVQKLESQQSASSKDLQIINTVCAVNYHLDPTNVNKLYQHIGLSYGERIINPAISESLKAVTAQYTAEELISKRSEVGMKIKEILSTKLASYYIVLDEVNLTEFTFSKEFNAAIEQKQIAEQQALKASLDLQRIEIEAQQKIEQAKAEAESLRLQKQEVTSELVELRKIEAQMEAIKKWDGQLPTITGGVMPFINVEGMN